MAKQGVVALILAAGKGTRMRSALPKVLHAIAGKPIIHHILGSLHALQPERVFVIIGRGMDSVREAVAPHQVVVQRRQRGTGDAVNSAKRALSGWRGDILVMFGDTPFVSPRTIRAMLAERRKAPSAAVVVLGMRPADPAAYGRLLTGRGRNLRGIVEFADATAQQRQIGLCNSGVMAIDGKVLFDLLRQVGADNAKGEFYLTDIVGEARRRGLPCRFVEAPAEELVGINSRADLAAAEKLFQARCRRAAMEAGVTLQDPETVYFSHDTRLARDCIIGPNVVFGSGVRVAAGAEIRAFCHIEGAHIGVGATVGPFARIRPGSVVGESAHVGNFVEMKNTRLGAGAKANHVSYLGDTGVGAGANIGAGTIVCNYDGFAKHRTEIGANAFIGSNSSLVAPVRIGAGAIVGAGSTITRNVAPDALAIARAQQMERKGGARIYRASRRRPRKNG